MNKRFYKAQALAIVMVVLVIASIIGVALFSRISKSRKAAIDQQNSNAAVETADSVLDVLVGANIDSLESQIPADGSERVYTTIDEMQELMIDLGLSPELLPDLQTWCPGTTDVSTNSFRLIVQKTDINDPVEVPAGGLMAFNFQDTDILNPACALTIYVNGKEATPSVFMLKKVYEDGKDPVVDNYCVTNDDTEDLDCDALDDVEYENSINAPIGHGTFREVDYNYIDKIGGDTISLDEDGLAEIRILPIKGTLVVTSSIEPSGCITGKQYNPIKITAEANCNGSYRAKQMFLPGSGNLGYSTLFDYGIYDNGLFQP